MRITGIRLQNIACFEDLSLDFTHPIEGNVATWTVILGENGTGKSTLLQMIAATSLDYNQLSVIASGLEREGFARGDSRFSFCRVGYRTEPLDVSDLREAEDILLNFGFLDIDHEGKGPDFVQTRVGNNAKFSIHAPLLTGGWFACGYGSVRKLHGRATVDRGALPTLDDSAKPYRFASLFGDTAGMTNVPEWISGLYFSSIFPEHTDYDVRRYEIARDAILRALPHISGMEVTKTRQVEVIEGTTRVPLSRLSDGYRGTLAWIGDLIRRLFDAYPDSDDPLKENGVVLVDEIDLHLHPKWQRSVVEDVRKLFPNLQFIVTSHSPFVAQDMRSEDKIIVLERSGKDGKGPVVAREENGSLESWSADQILSSYFGLRDGTRGEATQKAEARYVRLSEAEVKGTLTSKQSKELKGLRDQMNRVPVGETANEQAFYEASEAVLTKLRLRRDALRTAQTKNGHGNGDHSD